MADWSVSPDAVRATLLEDLRRAVVVSYYNFLIVLIQRTPKLTGQLKNNWITTLNGGSDEIRIGGSTAGEMSFAQAKESLDNYRLGDRISLRNNLPYANRIEYDGWSHTKAPEGMLRITAAEWPIFVTQAVLSVKAARDNVAI